MAGRWLTAEKTGICSRCRRKSNPGDDIYSPYRGVYLCSGCGDEEASREASMGEIETGVVETLKKFPPEAAESALARTSLYLARQLDLGFVADRDAPAMTKEIRQSMAQLAMEYPPVPEDDNTDTARKKRDQRMAGLGDDDFG